MVSFKYLDDCGFPFTYRLDGPKAVYEGIGVLHDDKNDYLVQNRTLFQIIETTKDPMKAIDESHLPTHPLVGRAQERMIEDENERRAKRKPASKMPEEERETLT